MKQLSIALSIEGGPTEGGHVMLDDLLRQLRALEDALTCVDREINGRTTLDYRVIDLSHSSPATVRIEPVLKGQYRKTAANAKYRNAPETVHQRFFHDLHTIRFQGQRPATVKEETFDALRQLIDDLGRGFFSGSIFNDATNIPLDGKLYEEFEKLSTPAFKSIGTVIGDLLTISFARGSRFYIYPPIGPTSVACHFDDSLSAKAKACIRKRVRVHGQKYFRPSSGLPFRIDVDGIEELKLPKAFVQLADTRRSYKGESADVQIAKDRDEWQ